MLPHVAQSRRMAALPVLALIGLHLAFFSCAFVGASRPIQALQPGCTGREVGVARGPRWQHKAKISPKPVNYEHKIDKQSRLAKDKRPKYDREKEIGPLQKWPVDIPEGVTMLHVEFDAGKKIGDDQIPEFGFPKPGNREVIEFFRLMNANFGRKVRVMTNEALALKELSPTKDYRKGAFEVVNLNKGQVLYSKLNTGMPLVFGEKEWWDRFVGKLRSQLVKS
eukprot:TRINITY_DN77212_c0_g1_i1.p2 TRINITY_DN77212_c0_g1~~TRINITY_DN77212_c0_g1_i1.p2  ORF type:complete len:223 (+),score=36.36 TRINITY_DN77212_c0_g1_i1:74-742(+)